MNKQNRKKNSMLMCVSFFFCCCYFFLVNYWLGFVDICQFTYTISRSITHFGYVDVQCFCSFFLSRFDHESTKLLMSNHKYYKYQKKNTTWANTVRHTNEMNWLVLVWNAPAQNVLDEWKAISSVWIKYSRTKCHHTFYLKLAFGSTFYYGLDTFFKCRKKKQWHKNNGEENEINVKHGRRKRTQIQTV